MLVFRSNVESYMKFKCVRMYVCKLHACTFKPEEYKVTYLVQGRIVKCIIKLGHHYKSLKNNGLAIVVSVLAKK